MQTLWDGLQQWIRIMLYVASGFLAREGLLDGTNAELFISGGMAIATGVWTVLWNRKEVVTVAGAQAAAADPAHAMSKSAAMEITASKA